MKLDYVRSVMDDGFEERRRHRQGLRERVARHLRLRRRAARVERAVERRGPLYSPVLIRVHWGRRR